MDVQVRVDDEVATQLILKLVHEEIPSPDSEDPGIMDAEVKKCEIKMEELDHQLGSSQACGRKLTKDNAAVQRTYVPLSAFEKIREIKQKNPSISFLEAKRLFLISQETEEEEDGELGKGHLEPTLKRFSESQAIGKVKKSKRAEASCSGHIHERMELVAVVHEGYPMVEVRTEQAGLLRQTLLKAMLSRESKLQVPLISRTVFTGGYLSLRCVKDFGIKWLKEEVPKLKPWPGAKLAVRRGSEYPRATVCTAYVPEEEGKKILEKQILHRVKFFNAAHGISTEGWRIIGKTTMRKGDIWFFSIEPSAMAALRQRKFHVFFGLHQIKITPKELEDEKTGLMMEDGNIRSVQERSRLCQEAPTILEAAA